MNWYIFFLVAAIIVFLLEAFGVQSRVSWRPLGYALVVASLLFKGL